MHQNAPQVSQNKKWLTSDRDRTVSGQFNPSSWERLKDGEWPQAYELVGLYHIHYHTFTVDLVLMTVVDSYIKFHSTSHSHVRTLSSRTDVTVASAEAYLADDRQVFFSSYFIRICPIEKVQTAKE